MPVNRKIQFKKAVREDLNLIIAFAGGTGSGKTLSALELATGLTNNERFAVIDTENNRAKFYADKYDFDHASLNPPFTSAAFLDAVRVAAESYDVVVIDSMSHEHFGEGGLLDYATSEEKRLKCKHGDRRIWIEPKRAHKKMIQGFVLAPAHIILCFRAQKKKDQVKDEKTGKSKLVDINTPITLNGWAPISGQELPYEASVYQMFFAEKPGVPNTVKPSILDKFFPQNRVVSSDSGKKLAEWAAGRNFEIKEDQPKEKPPTRKPTPKGSITDQQVQALAKECERIGFEPDELCVAFDVASLQDIPDYGKARFHLQGLENKNDMADEDIPW